MPRPAPSPDPTDALPLPELREVPEAAIPQLDAVPGGASPDSWLTWATDQKVDSLSRVSISFRFGLFIPPAAMAGTGLDAPQYDSILDPGPQSGLEVGVAILPVLSFNAAFQWSLLTGGNYEVYNGTTWDNWDFDDLHTFNFLLSAKVKLPLLLWKIKKTYFRFSRAEEIRGLILYFHGGVGIAYVGSLEVGVIPSGGGPDFWFDYYDGGVNLSVVLGGGIEIRWSWGGIALDIAHNDLGTPSSAIPPNSDSEALATFSFSLLLSVYF